MITVNWRWTAPRASAERLDDGLVQALEGREAIPALLLDPVDQGVVLSLAALPLIEPAGLQDLDVVNPGQRPGDLVAEVGVGPPGDRVLHDRLDDRRRVRDGHLLRCLVVRAADS